MCFFVSLLFTVQFHCYDFAVDAERTIIEWVLNMKTEDVFIITNRQTQSVCGKESKRASERVNERASEQVSELYGGPSIRYEKSVIFQRWKRMVWFYKRSLKKKLKQQQFSAFIASFVFIFVFASLFCVFWMIRWRKEVSRKFPFGMDSRLHFAIIDDH